MVKEPALPNASAAGDGGSYNTLQTGDPDTQLKIRSAPHEEVNVIGHNHVTAKTVAALTGGCPIESQRGMGIAVCQ